MTDILLLSLGTTVGLRAGDEALAGLIREAGASVEIVEVQLGASAALRRAYPITDLVEAMSARRSLARALPRVAPQAVIFSSTTSSLLAGDPGVPYAVRLDAPARLNRPGARNALQHALERRRMHSARLVLPFSRNVADALPADAAPAVVVPQPIEPSDSHPASGGRSEEREPVVVAYTPDPKAKGLDLAVAAWAQAGLAGAQTAQAGSSGAGSSGADSSEQTQADRGGARMEVFGIEPELARRHLARHGIPEPPGIVWRGRVAATEFRDALRQAHVFLTAARWEDFGFAQLEALADGALLVCGATGGPFEARAHARALNSELCVPDLRPASLAAALQRAFAMPKAEASRYRAEARRRMAAYRPEAVRTVIAERVLPALLG